MAGVGTCALRILGARQQPVAAGHSAEHICAWQGGQKATLEDMARYRPVSAPRFEAIIRQGQADQHQRTEEEYVPYREGEKETPTSIHRGEAAQRRVRSGRQTLQQGIVPRVPAKGLEAALERVARAVQQESQHLCANTAARLICQLAASCSDPPPQRVGQCECGLILPTFFFLGARQVTRRSGY
jgi:hypothetical protein